MENYEGFDTAAKAQTEQVTDATCPACGAPTRFDPETGKLKCEYCGYEQEIEKAQTEVEELDFYTAEQTASRDWGAEKKTVICESCGAQMLYDALQNSQVCPYCGSNHVMEQEAADTMTPGGVVPFGVAKQQAGELFLRWLKKRIFAPRSAKREAKADAFNGVYLPYWTYDTETFSRYSGRYGRDRTVTRDGKTTTVTTWHSCHGTYSAFIDDHLIPASSTQDSAMLRKIEPYGTKQSLPYKPEYVAGFVSERYQLGLKDGWEQAKREIRQQLESDIERQIRMDYNADHADVSSLNINYSGITYKYLLLPLWLSTFRYRGKVYRFMVNGQTGKVAGKFPVSPWRVAIAVLLGIAVCVLFYMLAN